MTFETEYQLTEYKQRRQEYFDEEGKIYGGLKQAAHPIAQLADGLIKQMEAEIRNLELQAAAHEVTIAHLRNEIT